MINGQPPRALLFGDIAVPTGFGRIGAAVGKHLRGMGFDVLGACIQYDGMLPPPTRVPFHVAALQGKDFGQAVAALWGAFRPDVVVSMQDFPYHTMLRNVPTIDWSITAHVVLTPVDGVPIYADWLRYTPRFDGLLTISEFGVQAFKDAGVTAHLCPPGVDGEFRRLPDDQRAALRDKMSMPRDAFIVGMMAQNQGRKDFPAMVEGFWRAFKDVQTAYLYLDCEKTSPAGWDIPQQLVLPMGLDPARVKYREDAIMAGVQLLNDRYNLLDLHGVIAHREGFGLPHIEALATGCPTMAIDYCSGREVVGDDERGVLVKATPARMGTWGGAIDYNADIDDLAAKMRYLYDHPGDLRARGERGAEWAKERTWEKATRAVEDVIRAALEKRKDDISKKYEQVPPPVPQQTLPAGVPIIHLNGDVIVHASNAAEVAAGIGQVVGQQVRQITQAQPNPIQDGPGLHILEGASDGAA